MPVLLSKLWLVLTLNYLFCDVFSLFLPQNLSQILNGGFDGISFTEPFLLFFSVLLEIPILMVILSFLLERKINKPLNMIAAIIMIIIQVGSLVSGENTMHYIFFSGIELIILLVIIVLSVNWKRSNQLVQF